MDMKEAVCRPSFSPLSTIVLQVGDTAAQLGQFFGNVGTEIINGNHIGAPPGLATVNGNANVPKVQGSIIPSLIQYRLLVAGAAAGTVVWLACGATAALAAAATQPAHGTPGNMVALLTGGQPTSLTLDPSLYYALHSTDATATCIFTPAYGVSAS